MSIPDPRLGNTIAGRYVIREVIGDGGQSVVYAVVESATGRELALKLLKQNSRDPNATERLQREHEALRSLEGTAALRVFDYCESDDGMFGIIMEKLRGLDFDDYLTKSERAGARMMPAKLVALLGPVVETVHAAHARGIVHRDLKPGNLFIVDDAAGGGVKVLDFGFAKFRDKRSFTAQGMIAGSPSYLAPEGWRGERNPSPAFDVYSFSAVLFRALAGKPPFDQDNLVTLLKAVTEGERPSLHEQRPDLPKELDDWVALALATDPRNRFQNMLATWSAFCSFSGAGEHRI